MTPEELKKELNLGSALLMMGRELKEISGMISVDEKVLMGLTGQIGEKTGLFVATNTRLIFVSKVLLSTKIEQLNYGNINNIQFKSGMIFGEILITSSGAEMQIKNIGIDAGKKLVESIQQQIQRTKIESSSTNQTIINQIDPLDQLEKLSKLKNQGIITEDEFNEKKKQLLGL